MSTQPIIIKKKKGGHHGGHHGGSWKVAYADFVTAMMAFFMVMWIMGMSAETRKGIASYFNDPISFKETAKKSNAILELPKTAPGASKKKQGSEAFQAEESEMQGLAQKVKQEVQSAKDVGGLGKDVKVTVTEDGLLIELVETTGAVFFESGSAVIRPAAKKIIQHLAPILAKADHPLVVQGHTDAAPFAGPGGNWGLSTSRAVSLMEELSTDGCHQNQFREVTGYADTKLERPDKPLDFSNRRVTILIPRTVKPGEENAKPAASLHEQLQGAGQPEAIDLHPDSVSVKDGDQKGKEKFW